MPTTRPNVITISTSGCRFPEWVPWLQINIQLPPDMEPPDGIRQAVDDDGPRIESAGLIGVGGCTRFSKIF